MRYSVVIADGKQFAGFGRSHVGVINGKLIQADSFSQLKRAASIEANKENKVEDTLYFYVYQVLNQLCFTGVIRRALMVQ